MAEGIDISVADGVQTIRFARPEKKNALTGPMYAAMNEALASGDASPAVVAHLFIGSGGIFTAGNDINDFLAETQASGQLRGAVVQVIPSPPLVKKALIAAGEDPPVGGGVRLFFFLALVLAPPPRGLPAPLPRAW